VIFRKVIFSPTYSIPSFLKLLLSMMIGVIKCEAKNTEKEQSRNRIQYIRNARKEYNEKRENS
jgi:hypothetical protein